MREFVGSLLLKFYFYSQYINTSLDIFVKCEKALLLARGVGLDSVESNRREAAGIAKWRNTVSNTLRLARWQRFPRSGGLWRKRQLYGYAAWVSRVRELAERKRLPTKSLGTRPGRRKLGTDGGIDGTVDGSAALTTGGSAVLTAGRK
jgi:hypothetical protein